VVGKEGPTYHVDTCSESIYRGSCDNELACVGGNDLHLWRTDNFRQKKIDKAFPITSKFMADMEQVGTLE
jgi:hypothetical protein